MSLPGRSLDESLSGPANPKPFPTAVDRSAVRSADPQPASIAPTLVDAQPTTLSTQPSQELPLPIQERFREQRAAVSNNDLAHRIANQHLAANITGRQELAPTMDANLLSSSTPPAGSPVEPPAAPAVVPPVAAPPTGGEANYVAKVSAPQPETSPAAASPPSANSPVTNPEKPSAEVSQASFTSSANPASDAPATVPPGTKAPEPKAPVVSDATVHQQVDDLTASLESQLRAARERGDKQLAATLEQKLSLLYLLAGRMDDAVRAPTEIPVAEQEAYRHLMFGLTTWLAEDELRRTGHRNAKVLHSLRAASQQLSAVSRLELRNLAFCEKVDYFGWYQAFPRAEFKPRQQVILYVEIDNHASELRGKDQYETRLQGSYQIFDRAGNVVAERQLPLDEEVCRNHRRDYFLAYRIYMPDTIADGTYRLELTVEDLQGKAHFKGAKLGEASIEFAVRN